MRKPGKTELGLAALTAPLMINTALADIPERALLNHQIQNGQLQMQVTDGTVEMTFRSVDAVEVVFTPADASCQAPSFAVAGHPLPVDIAVEESKTELRLQTAGLLVNITKSPFRIQYRYRGRDLIEEEAGFFQNDRHSGFRFRIGEQERIFGGGSRALGRMDRRGERLELYSQLQE